MGDFKSMLPDLKELGSMTSKLFGGIKNSVQEIVHDYKEKRATDEKPDAKAEDKKEPVTTEAKVATEEKVEAAAEETPKTETTSETSTEEKKE